MNSIAWGLVDLSTVATEGSGFLEDPKKLQWQPKLGQICTQEAASWTILGTKDCFQWDYALAIVGKIEEPAIVGIF